MAVNVGDEFRPGDSCVRSGVYRVTHDPSHVPDHEVTCVKGRKFPRCRTCGHPRFILVRGARRVEAHELFKGQ